MDTAIKPLEEHDVGHYGDLRSRPNPQALVLVFVPSLAAELEVRRQRGERELLGTDLQDFILRSVVIALSERDAASMELERGYRDIDPEPLFKP